VEELGTVPPGNRHHDAESQGLPHRGRRSTGRFCRAACGLQIPPRQSTDLPTQQPTIAQSDFCTFPVPTSIPYPISHLCEVSLHSCTTSQGCSAEPFGLLKSHSRAITRSDGAKHWTHEGESQKCPIESGSSTMPPSDGSESTSVNRSQRLSGAGQVVYDCERNNHF